MAARKPFVGGNWKSNGTVESTKVLCDALGRNTAAYDGKVEVVVCPIAPHLSMVSKLLKRGKRDPKKAPPIKVGAQDVSATREGAFTGEVSAGMLKDFRVQWTLVGHSERRTKYGETDEITAQKIEQCQEANIGVIFCIGEQLSEREAGKTDDVNKRMLEAVFKSIKDWKKIVIAYEPVWAIGTGKVATPDQAQEAHAAIRKIVGTAATEEVANSVRIIYGGSVSTDNCKELRTKPDIDGFLVGGASLKESFSEIITACVPPLVLKKAKFEKVSEIQPPPPNTGINAFVQVVKAPIQVEASDLMEVEAGDDTGSAIFLVQPDKAKELEVGKTYRVQNARADMIKGHIRLTVDKWAVMRPAVAEDEVKSVKKDNNISAIEYELTK